MGGASAHRAIRLLRVARYDVLDPANNFEDLPRFSLVYASSSRLIPCLSKITRIRRIVAGEPAQRMTITKLRW